MHNVSHTHAHRLRTSLVAFVMMCAILSGAHATKHIAAPRPLIKIVLDARYGDNKQLTMWFFRPDSNAIAGYVMAHPDVTFSGIRVAWEEYTQGRGYIGGDELPKTVDLTFFQGGDTLKFTLDIPEDNATTGKMVDSSVVEITPTYSTSPKGETARYTCQRFVTKMGSPYDPTK